MIKWTCGILLLAAACSGESNGTVVYPTKGCPTDGVKPAPVALTGGIPDAGIATYCSCQGQTFDANQGFALQPWAYEGACQPGIPVGRICGAPGLQDHWAFTTAGCDGQAQVACVNGNAGFDSGVPFEVCTCDGRTVNNYRSAYVHDGPCGDGGVTD